MSWATRVFFLLVAALAIAGVVSGAACTRRGTSTPIPPTSTPLSTLNVNPKTGSDTTGDGSATKPYKTLTKAIAVVKNSTIQGLAIQLAIGNYNVASGEKFPIVVPTGVTIMGTGYGTGFAKGSYINGEGEDTALEKLLGIPAGTAFATLEIAANVSSVAVNNVYVGSSHLPFASNLAYAALDAIGSTSASHTTFAADTPFTTHPRVVGILVPSGGVDCTGCVIFGGDRALVAFSIPGASAPVVALGGQPTQGVILGKIGIATDGTASVNASFQSFQSKQFGYQDSVTPLSTPSASFSPGTVDFGNGPTLSPGGNSFVGTVISEVSVTVPLALVYAQGDYWNPNTQGANQHGQYPKRFVFNPGARGLNVT
ncbi:MAG: DUF1565 domain-containing protein, partial [Candidatus Eremiobacteraeota bacterium]|nr:DUF1565 domain-containing protein [Candidatus Eremiobacteraeota bacterium]